MTDFPVVVARATEAETLGAAPNTTRLLVDADRTGGTLNAVRTTLGPHVDGPPPHFHRASPETFFMINGALQVLVGDRVVVIGQGDVLVVPPDTVHAWGTLPDAGADVLIVKAPGTSRFDYFRLADRIRTGQASPQEILDTQERFDNHFTHSAIWRQTRTESLGGAGTPLLAFPSDGRT
ncbi:cupin domain-containing protein [Microbispora sp. NPDC049125]|uniref:cupin domain-containing protein n=1 Tax=Microbispora sp. NPDC049125 TaxID=3154929 RepID=UPI003466A1E4